MHSFKTYAILQKGSHERGRDKCPLLLLLILLLLLLLLLSCHRFLRYGLRWAGRQADIHPFGPLTENATINVHVRVRWITETRKSPAHTCRTWVYRHTPFCVCVLIKRMTHCLQFLLAPVTQIRSNWQLQTLLSEHVTCKLRQQEDSDSVRNERCRRALWTLSV